MNPIKKAYCRIFQGTFHIALPFLPYRQAKMIDSITTIPSIFNEKHKEPIILRLNKHGLLPMIIVQAQSPTCLCLERNERNDKKYEH